MVAGTGCGCASSAGLAVSCCASPVRAGAAGLSASTSLGGRTSGAVPVAPALAASPLAAAAAGWAAGGCTGVATGPGVVPGAATLSGSAGAGLLSVARPPSLASPAGAGASRWSNSTGTPTTSSSTRARAPNSRWRARARMATRSSSLRTPMRAPCDAGQPSRQPRSGRIRRRPRGRPPLHCPGRPQWPAQDRQSIRTARCLHRARPPARRPGRLQVLPGRPAVILDVAHNPHAAAALARSLERMGGYRRTLLVLGMLQDKDLPGVASLFRGIADHWYLADL
ncbi:MAG: hypothetical protein KGI67_09965, partial [Pseudomonadota bacterium]|nr:hypothetical protein [Pseudomonadota bacterium]